MPKRSTATYSSEDAPSAADDPLHVYYCKYSGEHCFITDASLASLPRRRTDNSHVLDTQKYICRISIEERPPKLVKRQDGVEKQIRYYTTGDLPVCYRSEPGGQFLYILPDAVTALSDSASRQMGVILPPCIQQQRGGVHVALVLEDKAKACSMIQLGADEVTIAVTLKAENCAQELLEFCAQLLRVRLSQLSLLKGSNARSKTLVITGIRAPKVLACLQSALAGPSGAAGVEAATGGEAVAKQGAGGGAMGPPPPRL